MLQKLWRTPVKKHAVRDFYLIASKIQTTSENRATPSMRAAAMIIEVLISPEASGWRPLASRAAEASLPIPSPAPNTVNPAPKPAAR